MSLIHIAKSLCTKILQDLSDPEPPKPGEPAATTECAPEPEPTEFESFLSDIGAEANPDDAQSKFTLKDATIAELTARLKDLQALGDQLATTEQERLKAVARISELEDGDKRVEKLTRSLANEKERLIRMRSKFEERKRVAADRWHELLELRRELKQLKRAQKKN